MKLLVFLAKGFETIEFSAFIDVMGWAKTDFDCKIDVVTCGLNQKVISSFNVPVLVDKVMDEVSADEYDALAIPGGFEEFGFYEEAYNEQLLELIRLFDSQKKWIATVCVSLGNGFGKEFFPPMVPVKNTILPIIAHKKSKNIRHHPKNDPDVFCNRKSNPFTLFQNPSPPAK